MQGLECVLVSRTGFLSMDDVLTLNNDHQSLPLILAGASTLEATTNICSDGREGATNVVVLDMSSNPEQLRLEKPAGMLTGTTLTECERHCLSCCTF